jgi:hypothetical protein
MILKSYAFFYILRIVIVKFAKLCYVGKLSDCDLLSDTSVIVYARFIGITTLHTRDDLLKHLGILQIHDSYKTSHVLPEFLLIKQANTKGPVLSTDITFLKGQTGLWFLTPLSTPYHDIYAVKSPQYHWPNANHQQCDKLYRSCQ